MFEHITENLSINLKWKEYARTSKQLRHNWPPRRMVGREEH